MTQRYAHLADDALRRAAEVGGDLFLDAASANFFPKNQQIQENPLTKKPNMGKHKVVTAVSTGVGDIVAHIATLASSRCPASECASQL
jgi:hypothetical protein